MPVRHRLSHCFRLAALLAFSSLFLAAPVRAQDLDAFAHELFQRVNEARAQESLDPLVPAPELDRAAQKHSQAMADGQFFSHTGKDGSTPWDRILREGYRFLLAAENIAYGFPTPQDVTAAWMNSPGHRGNILSKTFDEIGIGVAIQADGSGPIYWTLDFG